MRKQTALMAAAFASALTFGAVFNATADTATIVENFGSLGLGSSETFGNTPLSSPFSEAYVFSLSGTDLLGAAIAIELDALNPIDITSVSFAKGTVDGTNFDFNAADVLATGPDQTAILATLLAADEPFAVIVAGTASGGNYAGTLQLTELTAVPLPAAAWLFGSALVGMVGVGYRRSPQA